MGQAGGGGEVSTPGAHAWWGFLSLPDLAVQADSGWHRPKAGSWCSPTPSGLKRCCQGWDAEGTSSLLFWKLMTALCLLQGKEHRESEDPKSCGRTRSRSPTPEEKCLNFESVTSLPEVSGQQVEWGLCIPS